MFLLHHFTPYRREVHLMRSLELSCVHIAKTCQVIRVPNPLLPTDLPLPTLRHDPIATVRHSHTLHLPPRLRRPGGERAVLFALSGRGHRTGDPYHENARKHENILKWDLYADSFMLTSVSAHTIIVSNLPDYYQVRI
jgi:hypothetical protein